VDLIAIRVGIRSLHLWHTATEVVSYKTYLWSLSRSDSSWLCHHVLTALPAMVNSELFFNDLNHQIHWDVASSIHMVHSIVLSPTCSSTLPALQSLTNLKYSLIICPYRCNPTTVCTLHSLAQSCTVTHQVLYTSLSQAS